MAKKNLNNAALRLLTESGSVKSLRVAGVDDGWILKVKSGSSEHTLASNARPVRVFKKLDTLVMYLKKIGITRFDIDT